MNSKWNNTMQTVMRLISIAKVIALGFLVFANSPAFSQNYWQLAKGKSLNDYRDIRISKGYIAKLDFSTMLTHLAGERVDISLPLPNGNLVTFRLQKNTIMAPELARKYPNISTYQGYQISNPANKGRFDISANGFHGMFNYGDEKVFIDPVSVGQRAEYFSYFKRDTKPLAIHDKVEHFADEITRNKQAKAELDNQNKSITTYRLAVAATGEYTQFHGGTVEAGLAAIVSMVNRINEVFLRELAIQFELVANNDEIIATDPNTDQYDNDDGDAALNTLRLNIAIGEDNYDLGHIVTTGAGGLAIVGGLCTGGLKGYGVTGLSNPIGDSFWIDYVAHEIGHQLGAEHTFNGTSGSCNNGRVANSAYEPGSGVTIMAYAGICGSQNLASSGLEYFHSGSLDQMNAVISQRNCGTVQAINNRIPAVEAGDNFAIPANTPFTLTGQATDSDDDSLSYEWQQFDLGSATSSRTEDMTDSGSGPLFRVFPPSSQTSRTFPKMSDVLSDTVSYGEAYPTTNRALNFRFIVRDDAGGVNYDDITIDVIDTGETFGLITPNGGEVWSVREQTIEWNVAGTQTAPVSCSHVDIFLSEDGGQNFLIPIIENTENDGVESVIIPNSQTSKGRIKVSCQGNVFFNVSKGDLSLNINYVAIAGQQSIETLEDEAITLSADMFSYEGGQANSISIKSGENYTVSGSTILPATNFFGSLEVMVTALINNVESEPFAAVIDVVAVNDLPNAVADTFTVEQDSNSVTIDVLANDSDVESSELTLSSISYSGQSQVEIVDNKIQYQPAASFSGQETITYMVVDEDQGQSNANLTITVNAASSGNSNNNNSTSTGSSGGGAMYWLLIIMATVFARTWLAHRKNYA